MKINRFDVVQLNNENKATILDITENGYYVEIVDKNGITLGNSNIKSNDIERIIFSKSKDKIR